MILAVLFSAALQPSFDCKRVTTAAERIICSDEQLAAMDVAVAIAYRGRKTAQERRDQRDWLRYRNECTDRACVAGSYEELMMLNFPDKAAGVRRYRSKENDGYLSILPVGKGWHAFSVTGQWRTLGGSVNIAMTGGAFRLNNQGQASQAPTEEWDCGWSIKKLAGDRWQVRAWPGSAGPACGGHNATIDGVYKRMR